MGIYYTFVERMNECGQNIQGTTVIVRMSNIKGGIREAAMQMGKKRWTEKILWNCQHWALQTCGIGKKEIKSEVKIYITGPWETRK